MLDFLLTSFCYLFGFSFIVVFLLCIINDIVSFDIFRIKFLKVFSYVCLAIVVIFFFVSLPIVAFHFGSFLYSLNVIGG